MVVLIDTNILLNFILKGAPYYTESAQIITWCAEKRLHGYLAFHSLSTIWYVLRKKTDEERRDWLKNICSILSVSSADTDDVLDALSRVNFKDFEDCLQDKCAKNVHADYLITGNVKDYADSETQAITPDDFCSLVRDE